MNVDTVASWAPAYGSLAIAGVPLTQATAANQPYVVTRPDGRQSLSFFGPRKMGCNLFAGANELAENITIIVAYCQSGIDADGYATPVGLSNTAGYTAGLQTFAQVTSSIEVTTYPASGNIGSWRITGATPVLSKSHVVLGYSYSASALIGYNSAGAFPAKTGTYAACNVGVLTAGNAFPAAGDASCVNGEISAIWVFRGAMTAPQLASACEKMKELYPEIQDARYLMPSPSDLSAALVADRATYLVSGNVSSWFSYMGKQSNTAIVTQGTAVKRPVLANKVVDFDGVNDSLRGAALFSPVNSSTVYTLAFAIDFPTLSGTARCVSASHADTAQRPIDIYLEGGVKHITARPTTASTTVSSGHVNLTGNHVVIVQRAGGAFSAYLDGTQVINYSIPDPAGTISAISDAAFGAYFNSDVQFSASKIKGAWSWTSGTVDIAAINSAIQGMGWV
jgi:hypothetical protein